MFRNPISHQQYSPPGLPTYTPIGSQSPNLNLPIGNLGYSFEQQSPDIKNAKAMDRQAIIEERRKERIKNALMQQLGTGYSQAIQAVVDTGAGGDAPIDSVVQQLKDKVIFNPTLKPSPQQSPLKQDYSPLGLRSPMPDFSLRQSHDVGRLPSLQASQVALPSTRPTKLAEETDWGAIIKHNDGLATKFQHDQQSRRKERQHLYKEELDYLKGVRDTQARQQQRQEQTLAEQIIRRNKEANEQARQQLQSRKQAMQMIQRDNEVLMNGGYKDRLEREHQRRVAESMDQQQYRQQLIEEQKHKEQIEHMKRVQQQNQYKEQLDVQAQHHRILNPPQSIYKSHDFTKGNLLNSGKAIPQDQQPQTSLPLDVNYNRFSEQVTSRAVRAASRMKQLHQYLENQRDSDGFEMGNKKERYHFVNDHLYQEERQKKLEAREINDIEKRAVSRRHMNQSLEKQVYSHTQQKHSEDQLKNLMLQQAKNSAFAEEQRLRNMRDIYKERQGEYSKILDAQVEQRKYQRKVDMGMNDYERRVNERALQDHMNQEFSQMPYKIPGITKPGEERQDMYIDNSLMGVNQSVDFDRRREGSAGSGFMMRSSSVGAGIQQAPIQQQQYQKPQTIAAQERTPINGYGKANNLMGAVYEQSSQARELFRMADNSIQPHYAVKQANMVNAVPPSSYY